MIIQCEVCQKSYYQRPSHFKRNKRHFCGQRCKGLGLSGRNNPAWKDSWEKTCQNCGKIFRYKDGGGKKFCSQKCMGLSKTRLHSKIEKCPICDKEIKVINAYGYGTKTCSRECANKLHSQRMTGEGNSNWQEGIGKLPYEWRFNTRLKRKIKERDGFKCKLCGKNAKEIKKRRGCGLAVHHIDYNKQNNEESNLITLCHHCHGFTHYNREEWKKELSSLLKE